VLKAQIHGKWQSFGGVFFDSSAKLLIFLNMVVLAITVTIQLTSCSNGKITVGHRFAIIANHYFPLSKALVATTCSSLLSGDKFQI